MLDNLITFLCDQLNTRSIPWEIEKIVLKKHNSSDWGDINTGMTNYLYVIQVEICKSDRGCSCYISLLHFKTWFRVCLSFVPLFTVQSFLFSRSRVKLLETSNHSLLSSGSSSRGLSFSKGVMF